MSRKGFSLVELLVVITIIAILLALIAPALDKAVYQAMLAKCGAKLRGIGSAALAYTVDHQRRYPHRRGVANKGWQSMLTHSTLNGIETGNSP